jgi:hypothetical protein
MVGAQTAARIPGQAEQARRHVLLVLGTFERFLEVTLSLSLFISFFSV